MAEAVTVTVAVAARQSPSARCSIRIASHINNVEFVQRYLPTPLNGPGNGLKGAFSQARGRLAKADLGGFDEGGASLKTWHSVCLNLPPPNHLSQFSVGRLRKQCAGGFLLAEAALTLSLRKYTVVDC